MASSNNNNQPRRRPDRTPSPPRRRSCSPSRDAPSPPQTPRPGESALAAADRRTQDRLVRRLGELVAAGLPVDLAFDEADAEMDRAWREDRRRRRERDEEERRLFEERLRRRREEEEREEREEKEEKERQMAGWVRMEEEGRAKIHKAEEEILALYDEQAAEEAREAALSEE
ncbi:hypothetical protein B9Z65_7448 [Elsinoe australis]|uniref:Uncharacterized protein n=1 Tax=Elsinoe australis TaxID=40998 RepID=A0A2P7YC69_9PEZI|nr:hypothetical protein B9Z65_7448 [Elsinoe australis]